MGVSIKPSGTSLNAAAPVVVLPHPAYRAPASSYFSVTSDGRFLFQLPPSAAPAANTGGPAAASANPGVTEARNTISIVLNWSAQHRR